MPDMTQGLWPNMWFLPATSGPFNELDFVQGGFTPCSGTTENDCPVGAGYFDTGGANINEGIPNVGFDASAGYHTYGIQWTPGVGVKEYVDGNLVWSVAQSQVPGGIVAEPYEIILNLQVATAADASWRTVPTSTSPGGSMEVAEVQAYS
jgi:beta-glucanase (GH16 family)